MLCHNAWSKHRHTCHLFKRESSIFSFELANVSVCVWNTPKQYTTCLTCIYFPHCTPPAKPLNNMWSTRGTEEPHYVGIGRARVKWEKRWMVVIIFGCISFDSIFTAVYVCAFDRRDETINYGWKIVHFHVASSCVPRTCASAVVCWGVSIIIDRKEPTIKVLRLSLRMLHRREGKKTSFDGQRPPPMGCKMQVLRGEIVCTLTSRG